MPSTVDLGSRARISAYTILDHLADTPCAAPDEVPWRAEALTPAWLTPRLCADTPGAAVSAVEVRDASSGSSVRKRITVRYNEAGERAGLVTHFFAKTTPTVLTRLTSGPSAGQEAKFFAQLRPLLDLETPVHRHSVHDRISGRALHLFEDLVATRGVSFCDYRTEFSRAQLEAALDLLARLHGRFHGDARLLGEFAWIPTYEVFFEALARTGTRRGHDQALEQARSLLPARLYAARERLWPAAEAGLAAHRDETRGVVHSDVHPGNWYLTADGQPGLCDWQCIAQGHWARDLAYALASMASIAQRRAWERELVAQYLARLALHGGPRVEFAHAWQRYGEQLPGALLMWTPTLCHPPTMPDMQPDDVSLEMIRRLTTAINDLGVLA